MIFFFIFHGNERLLKQFLEELKLSFNINITYNFNYFSTQFLDILIYKSKSLFFTAPYSKTNNINLPLKIDKRNFKEFISITNMQILRLWRISNNNIFFNNLLQSIINQAENPAFIKKTIYKFLQPVSFGIGKFNTNHCFCELCSFNIKEKNILMAKSIKLDEKIVSSKIPFNCSMQNMIIIEVNFLKTIIYIHSPITLHKIYERVQPYSTILIYGHNNNRNLRNLDNKLKYINIKSLWMAPNVTDDYTPIRLHNIFKSCFKTYQVKAAHCRKNTFYNLLKKCFNDQLT